MKKLKKFIVAIAVFALSSSFVGCKMVQKTPEAISKTVVAKIGTDTITKGDIDDYLTKSGIVDSLKQQYGEDYESNSEAKEQLTKQKQQALETLVAEKITLKKSDELGLTPSDDEINQQIDDSLEKLKSAYGDNYESALENAGITEDEYKEQQRKNVIMTAVIQDMVKDVEVTDDDVQSYYDENKDTQFSTGAGATVAHILIAEKDGDGNIDYDASLTKANEVKSKLNAGSSFADMAKKYGTDGTKDNGGDLGFIAYNSQNYDADFIAGFKDLKDGQISDPVKTQFGYHIIKVSGLKDAQVTKLEDVKDQIKSQLEQQKQQQAYTDKMQEWKDEIGVTTYEDKL
nr:peptidylprolyl isomerase [Clostridium sp. BJN0001]